MQILKDAFRKARKENKKGFTLVELLVVIAVIGILFVTLISKVDFATDKAKETGVKTTFRNYQTGLEATAREKNGFGKVDATSGVAAMSTIVSAVNLNLDKSIQIKSDQANGELKDTNGKDVLDPWGNAYQIYTVGKNNKGNDSRVVLYSKGKDGQQTLALTAANLGAQKAKDANNAIDITKATIQGYTATQMGDDIILVVDYTGGQVDTYSMGLSTNLGE